MSTESVAEHLPDPQVRVLDSNEDVLLYDTGHVPGALKLDWHEDLNDPVTRDVVDARGFAELAERLGIAPDTTAACRSRRASQRRPGDRSWIRDTFSTAADATPSSG